LGDLQFLGRCGGHRVIGCLTEVWWTPRHWMIGVLEFLLRCGGHRVTGWLESWCSYRGVLDTASLDDWRLAVLIEVCWTPRHWMTEVLVFLQRCAGQGVTGWLGSRCSYRGVLDTAPLDD